MMKFRGSLYALHEAVVKNLENSINKYSDITSSNNTTNIYVNNYNINNQISKTIDRSNFIKPLIFRNRK